jgi:hypothetical protein
MTSGGQNRWIWETSFQSFFLRLIFVSVCELTNGKSAIVQPSNKDQEGERRDHDLYAVEGGMGSTVKRSRAHWMMVEYSGVWWTVVPLSAPAAWNSSSVRVCKHNMMVTAVGALLQTVDLQQSRKTVSSCRWDCRYDYRAVHPCW